MNPKTETLRIGEYEVVIDPVNLKFSEETLTTYIQMESGFYDNFGAFLILAEKNLQIKEVNHEKIYCERFIEAKDAGGSDKLAEAKAKADPMVVRFKEDIIDARYIVNRMKQHLKAWDKNHENAQSLGHYQRKAMDKIHGDIYGSATFNRTIEQHLEKKIEEDWAVKNNVGAVHVDVPEDDGPKGPAEFETELSLDNLF